MNDFNNLVLVDVDGVILRKQSLWLLTKFLFHHGKLSFLMLLRILLFFVLYKFNFYKDIGKLRTKIFSSLRGIKFDVDGELTREFLSGLNPQLLPASLKVINHHKSAGDFVLLTSSSLDFIIEHIKNLTGANDYIAAKIEIINGQISGRLLQENFGSLKVKNIKDYIQEHGLKYQSIILYSDHVTDLELFNMVDKPIAVNPDRQLLKMALVKGWKVLKY